MSERLVKTYLADELMLSVAFDLMRLLFKHIKSLGFLPEVCGYDDEADRFSICVLVPQDSRKAFEEKMEGYVFDITGTKVKFCIRTVAKD